VTTVLLDGSVVEVGERESLLILPNGNKAHIKRTYALILAFLAGGEVFSREEILIAAGSRGNPKPLRCKFFILTSCCAKSGRNCA
jgi:hypothetical protein